MQIRAWSNEFVSGIPEVDDHHKSLFKLINAFANEDIEGAPDNSILSFLDKLLEYCEYHFALEEKMMEKNNYPLLDYHIDLHQNLKQVVAEIKSDFTEGNLNNPRTTIIRLSTEWLNDHIARDDLAFFSFYKNKSYDLGKNMLGKKCQISTLSNEVIGLGTVESITKNEIVISRTTGKNYQLNLNDIVKVSTTSGLSNFQAFIALVFFASNDFVKLFNATIIKTANDREYFRVKTDLKAVLRIDSQSIPASIIDISAVGMMIASHHLLDNSQSVMVEFLAQNNHFMELCKVVRVINKVDSPHNYGLAFESMTSSQSDKLVTFLFNRQSMIKKGK